MDKIMRFSVSIPEQLFLELDKKVEAQGYASRSEFTRDLIREKIVKDRWQDEVEDVIGIVTLIYSYKKSEIIQKVIDIQHDSNIKILSVNRVDIEGDNSIETIMVRGNSTDIINFSLKISGLKGIKFSNLAQAAVPIS